MKQNAPFVRKVMLAPQEAPPSTIGLLGWLRANMFNGPFNSVLSLVFLA